MEFAISKTKTNTGGEAPRWFTFPIFSTALLPHHVYKARHGVGAEVVHGDQLQHQPRDLFIYIKKKKFKGLIISGVVKCLYTIVIVYPSRYTQNMLISRLTFYVHFCITELS